MEGRLSVGNKIALSTNVACFTSCASISFKAAASSDASSSATPGKMTLRDAQFIEKLFFGRYSIGYLTRGNYEVLWT